MPRILIFRSALTLGVTLFALGRPGSLEAATHDIRQHGARGDKTTLDTAAIQAAIDACHQEGGGTVVVPPGDYLTGMLRLRNHVTLHLDNGATLWSSPNPKDYVPSQPQDYEPSWRDHDYLWLLVADDKEHITIEGGGMIRGTGDSDLLRRVGDKRPSPHVRIGVLHFRNCRDVAIRDITIRDCDFWTLHFYRCERLFLRGLTILNQFYHTNSDGIDPVSCRDVFISDCHIVAGDDCICLKADAGYPFQDVVVTNCTLESVATAIKIGTASWGDFRDVLISNCTVRNSTIGVGVYIKDGGTAERITFSNLSIRTLDDPTAVNAELRTAVCPIYVDVEQRTEQSKVGAVREMTFRDIQIESDAGMLIQGMPESPLHNITLQNVVFRVKRDFDYTIRRKPTGGKFNPKDPRITRYIRQPSYTALAHIDGLFVDNVQVLIDEPVFAPAPRSALAVFETQRARLQNIARQPAGLAGGEPVITLDNCRGTFVTGCFAPAGTPVFLGIRGERTADVVLGQNDLKGAKTPVARAAEVPSAAVRESAR